MVFKLMLALTISLTVSWAIGHLYPHDRPFVAGVGYNFLHHAADDSFPSDHGNRQLYLCPGLPVLASPVVRRPADGHCRAIAWSRVYLGVHWPLDMVGGLLAGMCGCLGAALIWHTFGPALYHQLQRLYRLCFSLPIRKGWVRG
ncbi:permease [Klebsiella pneumoniae]|uniref:Permease n=1 Tax=Klebsiella pneumoniae TaxID=573 RepID=A0A377UWP0_KLEPN|nr:permease [Klebsiella pneumoniae]